ncbi:hypothetical protein Pfra02_10840 [Pseudomonas fragi]|nr:hypothetical protein Pfra02_10840 [Pseudomonas fragi]
MGYYMALNAQKLKEQHIADTETGLPSFEPLELTDAEKSELNAV